MSASVPPDGRLDGPVHEWFGLSYCNYQVLHRTLMQSMPLAWQERMVACLQELHEAFAHVPQAPGYEVIPCAWVAPNAMDRGEMEITGVTVAVTDAGLVYHDRDGNELDAYLDRQPLPARDPVPHYNRGRTYIEPRLP